MSRRRGTVGDGELCNCSGCKGRPDNEKEILKSNGVANHIPCNFHKKDGTGNPQ